MAAADRAIRPRPSITASSLSAVSRGLAILYVKTRHKISDGSILFHVRRLFSLRSFDVDQDYFVIAHVDMDGQDVVDGMQIGKFSHLAIDQDLCVFAD